MRYTVVLSAHGNIDHGANPYEPLFGVECGMKEADTIEELQRIVREYISEYNLGSGEWTGGAVMEGNKKIGYISYNGRFWDKEK